MAEHARVCKLLRGCTSSLPLPSTAGAHSHTTQHRTSPHFYYTAVLKGIMAQQDNDMGEVQAEKNQLQTLAERFKAALLKSGTTAKVVPLVVAGDKLVQLVWDSL